MRSSGSFSPERNGKSRIVKSPSRGRRGAAVAAADGGIRAHASTTTRPRRSDMKRDLLVPGSMIENLQDSPDQRVGRNRSLPEIANRRLPHGKTERGKPASVADGPDQRVVRGRRARSRPGHDGSSGEHGEDVIAGRLV